MKEFLEKCAERRLLLHPETVSMLGADGGLVSRVLDLPEWTVVTPDKLLETGPARREVSGGNGAAEGGGPARTGGEAASHGNASREPSLEVLVDATGESEGSGELRDLNALFRDRLERLGGILKRRRGINPRKVGTIPRKMERQVATVGMVSSVSETNNGNLLLRIEDETGEMPAIVLLRDTGLTEEAGALLVDEVVGVAGHTRKDSDLLLVEEIMRPDVPSVEPGRGGNYYAAFISDLHVGSTTFLGEELERFFSWLRGDVGNEEQRDIAAKTRFLVIAGDVVDGVGVYPGQESHLSVTDLVEQYEEAANLLDTLPDHVEIIVAPGNHDAVRQAEPQPAVSDEFAEALDMKSLTLVSSPSTVSLDGVKVLVYHGRSLDDVVNCVPSATYEEPTAAMKELMRRRHLAPVYGSRTPISPEKSDFMLVDDVPDVLHCGHVHTFGMDSYRGVTLINSGTWQSQTDFQKRMGIEPDPGIVPLMNLSSGERMKLRFA